MVEPKEDFRLKVGETETTLPELTDYKPHANASLKPCYTLHLIIGGDVRSFQYYHLGSDSRFTRDSDTQKMTFSFDGIPVAIEGRNVWKLYDLIHQHRMPWIWLTDRDVAEDKETVITGISFPDPEE